MPLGSSSDDTSKSHAASACCLGSPSRARIAELGDGRLCDDALEGEDNAEEAGAGEDNAEEGGDGEDNAEEAGDGEDNAEEAGDGEDNLEEVCVVSELAVTCPQISASSNPTVRSDGTNSSAAKPGSRTDNDSDTCGGSSVGEKTAGCVSTSSSQKQ